MQNLIKQIYKAIYKEDLVKTVQLECPAPIVPPKTKSERLYDTALTFLGKDASPKDYASDEYGCMESVDSIYFACFGSYINPSYPIPSIKTYNTYLFLHASTGFLEVTAPMPGDIVISPTGYGKFDSGHVGIVGKCNIIMSNNSSNGKWEENYTITTWRHYFVEKGGFPMMFFRKI